MTYVGLTKHELIERLAEVPDDAPLYVPVDDGCFGLAKVEGVFFVPDEDHAAHTGLPLGVVVIDADFDGAQEVPFED